MSHFFNAFKRFSFLQATFVGSLLYSIPTYSDSMSIISVEESSPGETSIILELDGNNAPHADNFLLQFPDDRNVIATDVEKVLPAGNDSWIVICLDKSGSMGALFTEVQNALKNAVQITRPRQMVELLTFGTVSSTPVPFTDNAFELTQVISTLSLETARGGSTVLFESIDTALSHLEEKNNGTYSTGRIILISDGKDEGSSNNLEAVINRARSIAVEIDVVGYGNDAQVSSSFGVLRDLPRATGGSLVLPSNKQDLENELTSLLDASAPNPVWQVSFDYEVANHGRKVGATLIRKDSANPEALSLPRSISTMALVEEAIAEIPPFNIANIPNENNSQREDSSDSDSDETKWSFTLFNITFDIHLWEIVLALLGIGATITIVYREKIVRYFWPIVVLKPKSVNPKPQKPKPGKRTSIGYAFSAPSKEKPTALLKYIDERKVESQYAINQNNILIGNDADNDIVLTADDYVSSKHACIRFDSGSLYLNDLNSSNGTYLNGERIYSTPRVLSPDDEIRIGKTIFRLKTYRQQVMAVKPKQYEEPVV